MEEHLIEGIVIHAFLRGMARRNGTTTNTIDLSSEESASAEPQVAPKRKRYRIPNNKDCIRLVEAHTKGLSKGADSTCILCCENNVDVELIHSEVRGGNGKEHKCLNNRFCKSCIEQSIAAQETKQSVIIPQCPCCKQRVSKMVQLEDKTVLDLPPFQPERSSVIFANATKAKLVFAYNVADDDPMSTTTDITKWEVLAPFSVESDTVKRRNYKYIKVSWYAISTRTLYAMIDEDVTGWPDMKMLLRSINIKLKEINESNLNWLPKVYGGSLTVPKKKSLRKRKRLTTTSDEASSSSRTPRDNCDCSSCVRRRAKEAKRKRKKKSKKAKKSE